jgi:hypothetical protein
MTTSRPIFQTVSAESQSSRRPKQRAAIRSIGGQNRPRLLPQNACFFSVWAGLVFAAGSFVLQYRDSADARAAQLLETRWIPVQSAREDYLTARSISERLAAVIRGEIAEVDALCSEMATDSTK